MCRPTRCRQCGNVTWSGCGMHVDQVKAEVPPDEWCGGHDTDAKPPRGLRRLFG